MGQINTIFKIFVGRKTKHGESKMDHLRTSERWTQWDVLGPPTAERKLHSSDLGPNEMEACQWLEEKVPPQKKKLFQSTKNPFGNRWAGDWYPIYHHLPVLGGLFNPLSHHQLLAPHPSRARASSPGHSLKTISPLDQAILGYPVWKPIPNHLSLAYWILRRHAKHVGLSRSSITCSSGNFGVYPSFRQTHMAMCRNLLPRRTSKQSVNACPIPENAMRSYWMVLIHSHMITWQTEKHCSTQ